MIAVVLNIENINVDNYYTLENVKKYCIGLTVTHIFGREYTIIDCTCNSDTEYIHVNGSEGNRCDGYVRIDEFAPQSRLFLIKHILNKLKIKEPFKTRLSLIT